MSAADLMTEHLWTWSIEGEAEIGGRFSCAGVSIAGPAQALEQAILETFVQLRDGRIGTDKCKGPYTLTRIVLELGGL